jgi:hypothetical protein
MGVAMVFPTVSGSNLLRQKITLPQDFQGKFNLVFIPFEQWHQTEVNSWMPLASELEQKFESLVYYELPTIQSRGSFSKIFINEACELAFPT